MLTRWAAHQFIKHLSTVTRSRSGLQARTILALEQEDQARSQLSSRLCKKKASTSYVTRQLTKRIAQVARVALDPKISLNSKDQVNR